MAYSEVAARLSNGDVVLLDGGTGTELERRGVSMDPKAWCGPATLENVTVLEEIHGDYLDSGADVVTANTYASSRLMLEPAGFGAQFEEINRTAVGAAKRARETSGRGDVLVAGSLSHMCPMVAGTADPDVSRLPSRGALRDGFGELATLLRDEGCDLIILEMMYDPERMLPCFEAARETGLPVWAGLSARKDDDGKVLSFAPDRDIPFGEIVSLLRDFEFDAAGIMHTPSNTVGDAIDILREEWHGPLMAYPDSGYFKMPRWQFEDVIPPETLHDFAVQWLEQGVRILGGCCGLSPEHIAALRPLKSRSA